MTNFWKLKVKRSFVWFFVRSTNFSFGDFEQHDFWQVQVMRTFGWAPTEGELQELVGEIDQVGARKKILRFFKTSLLAKDGNGCITFNEFVWLMTRFQIQKLEIYSKVLFIITPIYLFIIREIHDGDIEEEIREAFRVFDKEGHGFIPVPDLTEVPWLQAEY